MNKFILIFISLFFVSIISSQISNIDSPERSEISGFVFDANTNKPLAFTNIGVISKNQGTVSNENGKYLLNISTLDIRDTVSFHFVGYKSYKCTIANLLMDSVVLMVNNIISISDFIVYGEDIDAKAIVKKILQNRSKNYKSNPLKSRMFIRNRYATDLIKLRIKPLKNSFDQLDDNTANMIERSVPAKQLSYTDFYGDIYSNNNSKVERKNRTKVSAIKIISLKDNDDYSEIENTFSSLFKDTKENEYWKVASGVFSTKINFKQDSIGNDTAYNVEEYKSSMSSWFFSKQINRSNDFLSMSSEESWEFLYKTSKYNYSLFGGSRIMGEDVYIIDFQSKNRGDYNGRLFVSCSSFAILKAEFEYAKGKSGTDVSMLGVSYKETIHKVSVFFVKREGVYHLKYLFRQEGELIGIDRKVELLKKKERFILDKTTAKYKVRVNYHVKNLNSIEILVINEQDISAQQFKNVIAKKRLKVKYINEFDDNMWQGYSIIAPTDQMKEYHKK
ncbi:MAG: carboxypeptidase-like regulatory domain-containing protein [Bacteroidales bacterium]|nr:carboxypeptidase-like regulatory domain-containing protein [Bacteroidales bacterium]